MDNSFSAPLTPDAFKSVFKRILKIAGCETSAELAQFLGIRQSMVSDARRRGRIPGDWLITLLLKKEINPYWVFTGSGPRHMRPVEEPGDNDLLNVYGCQSEELGKISSKELLMELLGRVKISE